MERVDRFVKKYGFRIEVVSFFWGVLLGIELFLLEGLDEDFVDVVFYVGIWTFFVN